MHSFFGQEFDSPHLHQNEKEVEIHFLFLYLERWNYKFK